MANSLAEASPRYQPHPRSASRLQGSRRATLSPSSIAGAIARPARMALTVLGIVIGMSALVATVGLTRTAGNRIISQFDQLAATELFISARPGGATGTIDPRAIPWTRRNGSFGLTVW
ncbi:ABC transporter permease [Bradyrhizobium japonicum]